METLNRTGLLLAVVCAICASAPAVAPAETVASQQLASETADEAAEEAAEAAEEATEAGEAATQEAPTPASDELAANLQQSPLVRQYRRRIAYLKELRARCRADLKIVRGLPHTTVRWLEHGPRKRLHIKQYTARIHELRALIAAAG